MAYHASIRRILGLAQVSLSIKKIKAILLAESPKVFIELHTPAEGVLQLLWLHQDPLTVYAQWMLCWIYVY